MYISELFFRNGEIGGSFRLLFVVFLGSRCISLLLRVVLPCFGVCLDDPDTLGQLAVSRVRNLDRVSGNRVVVFDGLLEPQLLAR